MPATQSPYPLSVSSTLPKASAIRATSWDSLHHVPCWDTQIARLHQGKKFADTSTMITSVARQMTDDQYATSENEMTGTSGVKALAFAITDKVFEVLEKLEQRIQFQDWPTLDEIKERVNGTLSNDFVMHFIKLDMDLDVCYSRLTKALEQYDHYIASVKSASGEVNPEKISDGKKILQEFVEIDENLSNLGWELQSRMGTGTGQVLMSIREYKRFIESELRSGWKSQRTIEEEWEWVKTVGQPAIPTTSGPVSAVTNVLGNTAMLDMRLDYKEQSELIVIHQEMYEQERSNIIELEKSVVESQKKIDEFTSIWNKAKSMIGTLKPVHFILQILRAVAPVDMLIFSNIKVGMFEAKERIKAFRPPIQKLVVQLTPYYKPGIHVIREVKNFTRYFPNIVCGLNLLLSAKVIICDGHEEEFEKAVLDLCAITSHQVQEIKNIYGKWITEIKPERQDAFCRQTEAFGALFQFQIEKIKEILVQHVNQEKSQQATIERNESDRYYKNWYWKGRPVTNIGEALDALRRVKRCALTIYHLSVLSATAQDRGQTSHNWPQHRGLPNETLHGCDSPKSAISTLLLTVASALDNLMVSTGRNSAAKKPKEQPAPISAFTRLKRGIFSFRRT